MRCFFCSVSCVDTAKMIYYKTKKPYLVKNYDLDRPTTKVLENKQKLYLGVEIESVQPQHGGLLKEQQSETCLKYMRIMQGKATAFD